MKKTDFPLFDAGLRGFQEGKAGTFNLIHQLTILAGVSARKMPAI
jgi:hypothetical protein